MIYVEYWSKSKYPLGYNTTDSLYFFICWSI